MKTRDLAIIKKMLNKTKWFIFPAILVLYTCTAILMFIGILRLIEIIYDLSQHYDSIKTLNLHFFSSQIISIIDVYLLAFVCYIFAIGIYKLFIGNIDSFEWLKISSIDDLKAHISKMTVLFLTTFLVQRIVSWTEPLNVMYYGIVITIISAILIWYTMLLQKKKEN